MAKYEIERAPFPEHPNRCQAIAGDGDQCMNLALPGASNCAVHGGNAMIQSAEKQSHRNYNLTKYKARVDRFVDNPGIKSLREEIGIVRLILEETLNRCQDDQDLMLYSSKVSQLVREINTLVNSAHKLESSMGQLLDKMAVIQLSEEIVTVISDQLQESIESVLPHVPETAHEIVRTILEADLVDKIVNELAEAMERAHSTRDG